MCYQCTRGIYFPIMYVLAWRLFKKKKFFTAFFIVVFNFLIVFLQDWLAPFVVLAGEIPQPPLTLVSLLIVQTMYVRNKWYIFFTRNFKKKQGGLQASKSLPYKSCINVCKIGCFSSCSSSLALRITKDALRIDHLIVLVYFSSINIKSQYQH